MTKQAFFDELHTCLGRVDETARKDFCADLDAHFQEGAAKGLGEDEICRNLGQPGDIAAQFLDEYKEAPRGREADDGDEIALDKTFEWVSRIHVILHSGDLTILPAPLGQAYRVTIKGRGRREVFTVENDDGTLRVEGRTRLEGENETETTIWIPTAFGGDLQVETGAGDADISRIGGGTLWVKNNIGDTRISACRFTRYELYVDAGDMAVADCAGDITARASAGDVTVRNHKGGKISAHSSASDVTLTDCEAEIDSYSSAGDVTILGRGLVYTNLRAETSAGSTRIDVRETRDLHLSASAGSINATVGKLCGETQLSAIAGNVALTAREVLGDIHAGSSAGTVDLRLPDGAVSRVDGHAMNIITQLRFDPQSPYAVYAQAEAGSVTVKAI